MTITGSLLETASNPGYTQNTKRPTFRNCPGEPLPLPRFLCQWARSGVVDWGLAVLEDLLQYRKAKAKVDDYIEDFGFLFQRFVAFSSGRTCLRLKFDFEDDTELGPNWLTMNLDQMERRAKEMGAISFDIEDEYFDAVFCSGLERISNPASLVAEVSRMLKQGGQVLVQTPLCGPYLPSGSTLEYWRFTPEGLHILLQRFDEIFCSVHSQGGSALRTWSYFYGLKPARDAEELVGWPLTASTKFNRLLQEE